MKHAQTTQGGVSLNLCFCQEQVRKFYILFDNLIKTPTFRLSYCSQLVLGGSSSPPEISLPCDGDNAGQSTCASHLIRLYVTT